MSRAIVLGALLLAGCQTTEERFAKDDAQCQSYGVAKGTPAYTQCRMQIDQNRANVRAAERFGTGSQPYLFFPVRTYE